jgi:putative ABC transport system permease protein
MLRSLWSLQRIDLGFNPDRVLTMRLALPAATYDTPAKVIGFYDQLLQDVRATPGVKSAGTARPASTRDLNWRLGIDDRRIHAATRCQHARRLAGGHGRRT